MTNDVIETVSIKLEADTSDAKKELEKFSQEAKSIGSAFSSALGDVLEGSKSLEDVFSSLALSISKSFFTSGISSLQEVVSSSVGGWTQSLLSSILPFAKGGVFSSGQITPFASGGVVSTPTLFQAGSGIGVMGEAGAEAIMPLSRGPDGKLGVAANNGGGRNVSVVMNVSTPDVQSFSKSENQMAIKLARAVGKGRRGL